MTFEEYKKWAKSNPEKCMAYDFKEEAFASDKDEAFKHFREIDDPIEQFLIYRSVDEKRLKSVYAKGVELTQRNWKDYAAFIGFDCDRAPLTKAIEDALWPDTRTLAPCSDTMSSQLTTLNSFVKTILLKNMFSNEKHDGFDRQKSGLKGNISINYILFLYETQKLYFLEKIKRYAVENKSCIYDFFQWSDTIGNFIPWPIHCNSPRGFNNRQIEDYWDLTLYCIYRWYKENPDPKAKITDNKSLVKLLNGENDPISNFQNWLTSFGSWDNFVEELYLQDYTEWCTRPYGRPKEFWDGHFSEDAEALPQTPEQFEAFFTHATACIKARSARMVAALRASVCNNNASPEKEKEA